MRKSRTTVRRRRVIDDGRHRRRAPRLLHDHDEGVPGARFCGASARWRTVVGCDGSGADRRAAPVRRLGVVYVPSSIDMDRWTSRPRTAFELTRFGRSRRAAIRMLVVSGLDGAKSKGPFRCDQVPDRIRRDGGPAACWRHRSTDRREGLAGTRNWPRSSSLWTDGMRPGPAMPIPAG